MEIRPEAVVGIPVGGSSSIKTQKMPSIAHFNADVWVQHSTFLFRGSQLVKTGCILS